MVAFPGIVANSCSPGSSVATTADRRLPVRPLLLGALGVSAVAFVVAPGTLVHKLHALAAGVCAQRPDHSYFLGGEALPLEARMGGIFAGFLVGVLYLFWAGRDRAGLLPPPAVQGLLLGLVALMGLDGLNALAYDVGGPALYAPQNALRLATGLLCGLAVALLAVPVLAAALWRNWDVEPSLASPAELAGPFCLLALIQVATMSGLAILLVPVALVDVFGLIACFAVGNSYALLLLTRQEGRATGWREASAPLVGGVLVAVVELVALAAFRGWAETTLGARWPI
jgi:uncharacterized membrane protein